MITVRYQVHRLASYFSITIAGPVAFDQLAAFIPEPALSVLQELTSAGAISPSTLPTEVSRVSQ
jgi:hypothetical protein